ncbi:homoserine dehydrogenase [Numidum massiliense]|uniref:homoserine dehydrogenase n=1 Tax=Numidum massiliense TaxID=1522315 RepID=UPI0006D58769|nr:homoserine dehydrogenase [Numidum massiliense]
MNKQTINVGLIGLGTVGSGVVRIIERHQEDLYQRTGCRIAIAKILVKQLDKERTVSVAADKLTDNPRDVLHDPHIDVVVEVMGGVDTARTYMTEALENGKHVVTANKDLMAQHGAELLELAAANKCDVFFEASVAGGIPLLRALGEGLSSDRVKKMIGIVNGTTNYILSKMSHDGAAYADVLHEAQQLGYAEADPTADVGGLDAARKMAILATLGFHTPVVPDDVDVTGITDVTPADLAYAKRLGYEMKLVGIAQEDDGMIDVSVQPTMIPVAHPLASVGGVFNAVYIYGEAVGETMFYGPGAGELPTATAVVADLVAVVKNMRLGATGQSGAPLYREKKLKADDQKYAKCFLRLLVVDRAGVLAKITQLLADYGISLEKVIQDPLGGRDLAEIVLITHEASKHAFEQVKRQLEQLDIVNDIVSSYRVEGRM